jgi:excisionase family DNA binding protein
MSSNIRVNRLCQYCDNLFEAQTTVTRYCSKRCNKLHYKAKLNQDKIAISNIETKKIIAKPIEEIKAKEFLTVKDAAKLLNSSRQTIYNLIHNGTIKATNLAKQKTLIKRTDIDKLFL